MDDKKTPSFSQNTPSLSESKIAVDQNLSPIPPVILKSNDI
jgi:hypothetical protein